MISLIAAVDENWGIGYNNKLLTSIPEDMRHFKDLTMGKIVVMGRKTWDSLPWRPLPGRQCVVITSSAGSDDLAFYANLDAVKNWLTTTKKDICIIGGGIIYKELLPYCDTAYITKIFRKFENVDTYCPNLDLDSAWKLVETSDIRPAANSLQYQFQQYSRM